MSNESAGGNPPVNESTNSTSVLSNTHAMSAILAFAASAKKPDQLELIDITLVMYMLARKAEDHPIFDSHLTLASNFHVDPKTIQRSQQRLERLNWIARQQRRGKSCALTLLYENLPFSEPQYTEITDAAKQLAVRYQLGMQKHRIRKRFPKGWLAAQHISAQRILNRCDGDSELAAKIISHALSHPMHKKTAKDSLYKVLARWKRVTTTFAAKGQPAQNATSVDATTARQIADEGWIEQSRKESQEVNIGTN